MNPQDVEVINVEITSLIKYEATAGWKDKRLEKQHTMTQVSLLQREIKSCALECGYHPTALWQIQDSHDFKLMCMIHIPS